MYSPMTINRKLTIYQSTADCRGAVQRSEANSKSSKGALTMIGPLFLRGDLTKKFREHLLQTAYHHVVSSGRSNMGGSSKSFSSDEVDVIMDHFEKAAFPIVCSAGSKSSNPFWEFHVALRYDGETKKDAFIYELLVREPVMDNLIKGIMMAFYVLVSPRFEMERIIVPFHVTGLDDVEDILVEKDTNRNITILSRRIEAHLTITGA
jgi:hypothetical protein